SATAGTGGHDDFNPSSGLPPRAGGQRCPRQKQWGADGAHIQRSQYPVPSLAGLIADLAEPVVRYCRMHTNIAAGGIIRSNARYSARSSDAAALSRSMTRSLLYIT